MDFKSNRKSTKNLIFAEIQSAFISKILNQPIYAVRHLDKNDKQTVTFPVCVVRCHYRPRADFGPRMAELNHCEHGSPTNCSQEG